MEPIKFDEDSVLKRIIKNASRFLRTESPRNLDPFVRLVMETIASEVYLLSDNAANIESRLLEKLASVLVPTAKTTALPAYAVLSVQPIETECILKETASVYYEDFLLSKNFNISELTFFPTVSVCLKKGVIRYLMCNGKCFLSDPSGDKEYVGRFSQIDLSGKMWIGLDMDPLVSSLKGLTFYWNFPKSENRNEYIRLLEYAKWNINGEALQVRQGFVPETNDLHPVFDLLSGNDVSMAINRDICNCYTSQFVTITDVRCFTRTLYPEELSDRMVDSESVITNKLNIPLVWIQVDFPPLYTDLVLEQCSVCLNAFPIVQKNLKQIDMMLDELKNIIPLKVRNNEHFLSVRSVCDSSGRSYYERSEKSSYGQIHGSYSLRHGGCERFDSRDAKDYLYRLTHLLSEEQAAFASASKENVVDITREMQILLERMKKILEGINVKEEITNYLLLDSPSIQESMSVSYWTTNGEIGNGLMPRLPLIPSEDSGIDSHSVYLITDTSGGRGVLTVQEKVICFRNAFITRGRIFTKEDIISFCMAAYPGLIRSVSVKNGIMKGGTARKSLFRTIDVCLSFGENKEGCFDKEELCRILERKLKECSPETFNYRVSLQ